MRKLILLALVTVLALPAYAARRVTVEQLEQTLTVTIAEHMADADMVRQIGALELSERLTDATLNRFAARFALSPRMALALQLLADQSAFLDPPAGELPATAPPDTAAQQQMMDAARGYAVQTLPHLPNFFATRTTHRFDNSPQVLEKGGWAVRAGLHPLGSVSRQITYRDGQEIQDTTQPSGAAQPQQEIGLHSWGEFGPALTVVMTDTAKGTVTFNHWEQTPAGLAAVYRYSVPRAASHYGVTFCCIAEEQPGGVNSTGGGRGRSDGQMINQLQPVVSHAFRETPGYHGSLFIDPATGAILRITLEAELKSSDPLLRAATVIEYGPVSIGDQRFICPVRALALSMEEASHEDLSPLLLLNETSFTHYHRLGASARILADAGEHNALTPVAPPAPGLASPEVIPASSGPAPAPGSAQPAEASAPPAAQPPATPPTPPPAPVIPEISMAAANGVPDQPANFNPLQTSGYTLKVSSRLVDVSIVAYDKKGHPVKDLRQEEIEVYDNGRKQELRFFSQIADQAPVALAAAPAPERSFSNRAVDSPAAPAASPAAETGYTVLLIDESHIAWGDLNYARQQMIKFLASLPPTERVGIYTMTGIGFRVLQEITADHAVLTARLQKFSPSAQSVNQAQEDETRNRQSFNEVHNVADLDSVNGNRIDEPVAVTATDPQLLNQGSNPARASLIILVAVARHLSAIPGHKNLVWVSSDNVFADWRDQDVSTDKGSRFLDSYAQRAQEVMNDAHVAVYPFDVSQLEAQTVSADIQHRNVELTQAAAEMASMAGKSAPPRNMTDGRITAEMNQDLHPIQPTIRQVADATGGRTIRRSSDLAAELSDIIEDGHAAVRVSFYPQGPADGQYHTITVKLTGRQRGLTLRYRTGYLYAKEAGILKERFQQAVWEPLDANQVAVSAKVVSMDAGASVKIEIAAGDLGLQERDGRWTDKLDIFFIQRDDAGLRAQVEGQTLGLRLKSSTYQNLLSSGIPFDRFVQMKPATDSLRVLVVDENSGCMGSVTIPASAFQAGH
ncbi:MAG: VWA domain-containing protein [Terracidiphilus sp.]